VHDPGVPGRVAARDLAITYRGSATPALQGVSFEVEPGTCLLVVGPSGSGKSTLGLAIAGLVPREIPGALEGSLTIDGVETGAFEPTALASRVGVVFQDPGAQIVMERVEDDVAFGLENRAWPLASMRARVPGTLVATGLAGLERHRSNRLSGGQQQRLALAGVLAPEPGVLVFDEPTANLDPAGTAAFFERLAWIRERRVATIMLVEHRVDAAWPLADLVLALGSDGSPIDIGRPAEVLARSGTRMRDAGIWLPGSPARPRSFGDAPAVLGRAAIRASAVRFGYDRREPIVRDIELQAAGGERIALVGPNGSGKSTLGRLLVGLLRPDYGIVRLGGADPARLPAAELARRAGFVFQDPESQFLADRVEDEVLLGLRPDERAAAGDLMDRLGMPFATFGDRSPYRLSGGEGRRLSLACVLVRSPGVLVLDEPTFGQDRRGYEGLLEILRERLAAGTCLIAATHDERFVAEVADRIVELGEGWIVRDEVLEEVA
jgi:energy-coupling factor transporter ATP-binding protein EcfA2